MNAVRILLVAADPLARAGLAALLAEEDRLEIVGQVEDTAAWDDTLIAFRPDVILWDLGWEAIPPSRGLLADMGAPLLLLVPDDIPLIDLLSAGVSGVLPRATPAEQITSAVQSILHGLFVLSPEAATNLSASQPAPLIDYLSLEPLTGREMEVLSCLADGLTNKAIGQVLQISPHTVKFHLTNIMSKLDAQSRTEVVAIATRAGLLSI